MTTGYAVITAIGICLVAAALEGVCAGSQVKPFFARLRFPPYSAPLWLWSIIGGLYYVIFWFILYRLLKLDGGAALKSVALALILVMMVINALTNYLIFRAQNLRFSFIVGAFFPVLDAALFLCLMRLDQTAASSLIPYLLYRVYAVWWGYGLWKLNGRTT
ncbi:MAG: tryptophan-rich sensory protein [Blastocatellia bacterium]